MLVHKLRICGANIKIDRKTLGFAVYFYIYYKPTTYPSSPTICYLLRP